MITEQDLQAAIAECQGQRNPTASTCLKLAAFLTIKEHMYPKENSTEDRSLNSRLSYSFAPPPENESENTVTYQSGTEFSEAIYGKTQADVWPVIDELMDVIKVTQPRLYAGVMRKLDA